MDFTDKFIACEYSHFTSEAQKRMKTAALQEKQTGWQLCHGLDTHSYRILIIKF
jgi:hypothetical protein